MRTVLKSTLFTVMTLALLSCGGNKKEDKYGNPISEEAAAKEAAKPEASTYPLAEKGKTLFEGKGTCATCHKIDTKAIGPSVIDIAKKYQDENASIATFLNGESEAIVDPTQFEVMKANFAITKELTNEERKSLEEYFLSNLE
jgi:cytochrome c